MRFLNMVGNKFFAWLLSFVLGQYVKDTLCGTKAMLREDYLRIAQTHRQSSPRTAGATSTFCSVLRSWG